MGKRMVKKRRWQAFLLASLITVALCHTMVPTAYADDVHYYTHLDEASVEDIFELEIKDIPNAWRWITEYETWVVLEERNGQYTFWWNVPNLQQVFYNMLYEQLMSSGYGVGVGVDPKSTEGLVEVEGQNGAHSAMGRYGFKIPVPVYMGERPLITLSVLGVLIPDSVFDGAGRAWDLLVNGEVIDMPTDKDLDSLVYVLPNDYDTAGATFRNWVKDNWYAAIANIDENQKLLSIADDNGMFFEKQWCKKQIITEQGLDQPGLEADYICQQLEEICGRYYANVAQCIMICSGLTAVHHYERIMPYDVNRMTAEDAILFDGLQDPRAVKQENLVGTGYLNIVPTVAANWLLSTSGGLSEKSVFLNTLASFETLEAVGFDPVVLWNSAIVQFLVLSAVIMFILLLIRSSFKIAAGSTSYVPIIWKGLTALLVILMIMGISRDPAGMYDRVKNGATFIFNQGSVALQRIDSIEELYGDADEAERENVNLWLPYFNAWTTYQTGHGLLEECQTIQETGAPEEDGLVPAEVAGVEQELWCTVLAEMVSTDVSYTGNVYRMVDHFLAPRITINDPATVDITVEPNENWEGTNIQSRILWEVLPFQLLILILTVIKLLLFMECVFNFVMLLVNIAMSVGDNRSVVKLLKELPASMVNVAGCNVAIVVTVWTSMKAQGFFALLLALFYYYLVYVILKNLTLSNGPFSPKILRKPIIFLRRMLAKITSPTGDRGHWDPEQQNDEGDNDDGGEDTGSDDDGGEENNVNNNGDDVDTGGDGT